MSARGSEESPRGLQSLLARLVLPADEDQIRPGRRISPLVWQMAGVAALIVVAAVVGVVLARGGGDPTVLMWVLLGVLVAALGLVGVLIHQVQHYLLEPLAQLRAWSLSMCGGDLSARLTLPEHGEFAKLAFHINRLSAALEKLANRMDETVRQQTERLQQKNRSLEILYEIAASINASRDTDGLLERSARTLMATIDAPVATVWLCGEDGRMRLAKTLGTERPRRGGPDNLPRELRESLAKQPEQVEEDTQHSEVRLDMLPGVPGEAARVTIPLHYRGNNLGVYYLYTPDPVKVQREEQVRLLGSVGKHLGMAIEKAHLDKEAQDLSIIRERTALAHELHDSLAQTLASLRFQVKMLDDSLDVKDTPREAAREVQRIKNSLDEANTELRELLANFRAPIDERGLLPALEDMVTRFRSESGITTYFQSEIAEIEISPACAVQVLRIVREGLANVRKHSRADTVRVLVRGRQEGQYRILVEDDGVGIGEPVLSGHPGEHIGLSIMQERARHLGGELSIDSESGEGTRLLLSFKATVAKPVGSEPVAVA